MEAESGGKHGKAWHLNRLLDLEKNPELVLFAILILSIFWAINLPGIIARCDKVFTPSEFNANITDSESVKNTALL